MFTSAVESRNDPRRSPGGANAEGIDNGHECGFSFAVGNHNDVVCSDRDVLTPATHHRADVYGDLAFLPAFFAEDHGSSRGRCRGSTLSKGNGLAKCGSFF